MTDDIAGKQDGAPQRRRARSNSFSPKKRQRFLDALALTCNVRKSADHAGVDHTTPYYHRARDARFAEQWRDALATGYDRLEALVLEHGGAGEALLPANPDRAEADGADPAPFDFDRAIKVLQFNRGKREGRPATGDRRVRANATREETNAALLKALAAAKRRIDKSRARDD